MAARLFWTAVTLLLAAGGFFGAAPTPASPLNPFGILFLVLSGLIWLGWETIRSTFSETARAQPHESAYLLSRLGPFHMQKLVLREPSKSAGRPRRI
jgi:hypothetical protein